MARRCVDPVLESFDTIASAGVVASDRLERARRRCDAFAHEHGARFEARRAAGRAVDAHGDLHLQHVWLERDDAEPVMIDGLEFDARLREIDVAAEIGFTAMDLHYRGRADLASLLLRAYALESGDFDLYGVVDYFVAYRAAVRGKVAAIAAGDTGLGAAQRARAAGSAERHVDLAVRALARRPPGAVALVGGIVGTGKSTVAGALADALDAAPGVALVSSDRVRKHLAGLGPLERTDAGLDEGLYAPERVARTYETLTAWARPVSESGRVVVLDATWSSRLERHRALTAATALGARWLFVETRCAEATTRERLRRRREAGGDPSDAGEEMYAPSVSRFEPLEGDEALHRRIVATDGADWRSEVAAIAEEIRGG